MIKALAVVAKWLTHRFVDPAFEGSIPFNRPIKNFNLGFLESFYCMKGRFSVEFLKPGTPILVHAYKQNGKIYRCWENVTVLQHDADEIVLMNKTALITEKTGAKWRTSDPAIWIFKSQRWSNVICMSKNSGLSYYVNISSPFVIEEGALKYIDYDLDIRVFANGTYSIVDLKEFQKNSKLFKYSNTLLKTVWAEVDLLEKEIKNNKSSFNYRIINDYWKRFNAITKSD